MHQAVTQLKDCVQRKLRQVKSIANRLVLASDNGTGQDFVFVICCHLIFAVFPFPVNTAQLIGEFCKNEASCKSDVVPKVIAQYIILI